MILSGHKASKQFLCGTAILGVHTSCHTGVLYKVLYKSCVLVVLHTEIPIHIVRGIQAGVIRKVLYQYQVQVRLHSSATRLVGENLESESRRVYDIHTVGYGPLLTSVHSTCTIIVADTGKAT